MKRNLLFLTLFFLPLHLLASCMPLSRETGPVVEIPTLEVPSTNISIPTTPTFIPAITAVPPTSTMIGRVTAVSTHTPEPVTQDPVVITNDATNVRRGPSLAYDVSYVLSAGTTAPILGRNNAGDWWAVPGPGDGPGRQFALVARLGNWAEVLKTEAGWRQILLGPSDVGWISDEDVDLTGPCATPEPVPERIQFAPGETSITLEGMLEPPQRDFYLFRAFAGQQTTIEIVSEFNQANFALSGMSDGQPYKRVEDELRSWSAELPATQDYLLTVAVPADAATTGYRIFLTIEPLEMQP